MTLYVLPYLMYFVTFFAKRLCFCFIERLTVGLAMSGVEFRSAYIAVGFFKWSL